MCIRDSLYGRPPHPRRDYHVEADVVGAELVGQVVHRRQQRALGCGISALGHLGLEHGLRADQHDRPATALPPAWATGRITVCVPMTLVSNAARQSSNFTS